MRAVDKLDLASRIGRELQSRYSFAEIDRFLTSFGVKPGEVTINSKWAYSRDLVSAAPEEAILKIAEELDIIPIAAGRVIITAPRNWKDTQLFRLFISHISKDKVRAARLRDCLAPYGIAGFVAHEDIHPTLEWLGEIERALSTMDAFLAVHTGGFSRSNWTQQEIGFAVCRGVKIVSLEMGELPTGFLSKQQAVPRRRRTAEQIAEEINAILQGDPRTADRLKAAADTLPRSLEDEIPF